MRLLLDTHSLLWFLSDNRRLSDDLKEMLELESTDPLVSVVSLWEVAIKMTLGKLQLPIPFDEFVDQQLKSNHITVLYISINHLKTLAKLPLHHRDPFDRLIIAQAIAEDIPIVSADSAFDAYNVKRLW